MPWKRHQCLSAESPIRTWVSPVSTSISFGESSVPFGRESYSDNPMALQSTSHQLSSSVPFGRESYSDTAMLKQVRASLKRHQCLSAESPIRTSQPSNIPTSDTQSSVPFGRESYSDYEHAEEPTPSKPESSVPFGRESYSDTTASQ